MVFKYKESQSIPRNVKLRLYFSSVVWLLLFLLDIWWANYFFQQGNVGHGISMLIMSAGIIGYIMLVWFVWLKARDREFPSKLRLVTSVGYITMFLSITMLSLEELKEFPEVLAVFILASLNLIMLTVLFILKHMDPVILILNGLLIMPTIVKLLEDNHLYIIFHYAIIAAMFVFCLVLFGETIYAIKSSAKKTAK